MTAATARRQPLPDPARLRPLQLAGIACASCGRRFPPRWQAARHLGKVTGKWGFQYGLYVCAEDCQPGRLPRRVPDPRPGRHLDATAPSAGTPCDNTPHTIRRVLARLRASP